MFDAIARRIFGSANDRYVRGLSSTVDQINALEPEVEKLTDEDLSGRTNLLKERISNGETLDQILPDAFATVREVAKRTLGERPYDVQLVGAIVLHRGMIAEMKTGEGKTLTSTMAVYLNALEGKGVHIVTVNDYLASRDADWMGKVYDMLGLTVGCVIPNLAESERAEAYRCDITYGTNSEFGFDYLRDNMKFDLDEMVQRPFNYGIVDEVDSILIDEARTPLIISGASEDSSELYNQVDKLIPNLVPEDYEKDEKVKAVTLTDQGNEHVEELLSWVGLKQRMQAFPSELSGGEKQRVAIARAVIRRPDILLADEPTGNVDPEMAERLMYLFVELNKLGTTIVIATHDNGLVSKIGAPRLHLETGKLLYLEGTRPPSEFLNQDGEFKI